MKVYCPFCRKDVEYLIEKRDFKEFRGIEVNTFENVAICKECKNDLYVNDIEKENNKRIYDIYKSKVDIITPEEIVGLRKKYNISQRELTSILGFGKMTINRYEQGRLPLKSHSDYIKLLINNEKEFLKKVKESYDLNRITQRTYQKVMSKDTSKEMNEFDLENFHRIYINKYLERDPDINNGYKNFDLDLLENVISYIASKVKNLTITSLNKYLWFIDCLTFKEMGVSITGLTYVKEQFGPTIISKKYYDIASLEDKYKRVDVEDETGTKTYIVSKNNYNLSNLSKREIDIIDDVINLLKDKKVTEISELSHKQDGWKKTKKYEMISFEYALNMNIDDMIKCRRKILDGKNEPLKVSLNEEDVDL